jgi:hypothetical protein
METDPGPGLCRQVKPTHRHSSSASFMPSESKSRSGRLPLDRAGVGQRARMQRACMYVHWGRAWTLCTLSGGCAGCIVGPVNRAATHARTLEVRDHGRKIPPAPRRLSFSLALPPARRFALAAGSACAPLRPAWEPDRYSKLLLPPSTRPSSTQALHCSPYALPTWYVSLTWQEAASVA